MRCPRCNARLTKKNKFCPECGETVVWEECPRATTKGIHTLVIVGILLLVIVTSVGILFALGGIDGIWNAILGKKTIVSVDIEEVKDSVVMIEVYDADGTLLATGSGFCTYKENWIATNFHVIEGAKEIRVITDDYQEYSADEIVFLNKNQDLAVLSFDGNLKPLKLGDCSNIKIKDKITTIGSPKGELNTVSEGIISNLDDEDQIRMSAPISHGSSGGVLLNQKYEVIGITSAGYDDAQNLNFAIKISLLEELIAKYEEDETVSITKSSLSKHIGSLKNFDNYLNLSKACYEISSLDVFYNLTDNKSRFEVLLEDEDYSWFCIYDSLSRHDKKMVADTFVELNGCEFDDNNVDGNIDNWSVSDFFISLGVLNRYEYAITVVDVENYTDKDAMFNNVNENYPLDAAEKTLILYLIGEYDWSEIHTDNKEDMFDYFDSKYGTKDLGAILELLGYDVVYENDGTLTAYW